MPISTHMYDKEEYFLEATKVILGEDAYVEWYVGIPNMVKYGTKGPSVNHVAVTRTLGPEISELSPARVHNGKTRTFGAVSVVVTITLTICSVNAAKNDILAQHIVDYKTMESHVWTLYSKLLNLTRRAPGDSMAWTVMPPPPTKHMGDTLVGVVQIKTPLDTSKTE